MCPNRRKGSVIPATLVVVLLFLLGVGSGTGRSSAGPGPPATGPPPSYRATTPVNGQLTTCVSGRIATVPGCRAVSELGTGTIEADSTSHSPWLGAVVGVYTNVSLPEAPDGIAADPATGALYISGNFSGGEGNITVMSNGSILSTIPLPGLAAGLAFDPGNGLLYAAELTTGRVAVISGSAVVANVSTVGRPQGIAYDPVNGDIYVANESGTNVSIIAGESVVATVNTGNYTPYQGGWFGGVACDPTTGLVYVTKLAQQEVAVLNGTRFVENLSLPNGDYPQDIQYDSADGLVYVTAHDGQVVLIHGTQLVDATTPSLSSNSLVFDPANGLVYVDNYSTLANDSITAINGTSILPLPFHPWADCNTMGYDPTTGDILAACGFTELLFISTRLTQSPVTATPSGDPSASMDVGQTVTVNATFVANGMGWNLSDSYVTAVPSTGLSCMRTTPTTVTNSTAAIYGTCVAASPGNYQVLVGSGNSMGFSLNSSIAIHVYPAPSAGVPTASIPGIGPVTSADVGQTLTLDTALSGGTGLFSQVSWSGLPPGACGPTDSIAISCTFATAAILNMFYSATDSNGVNAPTSPTLAFQVYPLPVALAPQANRSSADVNQPVEFTAGLSAGTGAPGPATVQWSGLPAGCLPSGPDSQVCRPNEVAVSTVRFGAIDANGGVANESPPLVFHVYADPVIAIASAGPPVGIVGEGLYLNASVSGGSGGDMFSWSGLPAGCQTVNATLACVPQAGGVFQVTASVSDSNGFLARSGTLTLTISNTSSTASPPSGGLGDWEHAGIGGGAVLAVAAVILLFRRRPPRPASEPGVDSE